jgi:putative ABC transport system ATP-binding protein
VTASPGVRWTRVRLAARLVERWWIVARTPALLTIHCLGRATWVVSRPSGCTRGTSSSVTAARRVDDGQGVREPGGERGDQLSERGLARLRRDAVGFVFQAFHLMDELTAVENVELPALLAGRSPRATRKRALELLGRTGLADRAKFLPSALSGGQRSGSRSPAPWPTSR